MKRIICITLLALTGSAAVAQTAGDWTMKLQYQYGLPMGDMKEKLVSNGSPRGFAGELAYHFSPQLSLGLGVSYQDFYQKYDRATYHSGNQSINAVLTNSIQVTPLMLQASYSLGTGRVQPVVSLGAGANMINFRQFYGEFSSSDPVVRLAAGAGLALKIPFGQTRQNAIHLGGVYHMLPYNRNGIDNLNHAGIRAGVSFRMK